MNLFVILAKKAISATFAEVLRRKAVRWMKGELSLQDGYERLWRRSAHADDERLQEPKAMRELLPGLYHWQAFNTHTSHEVDCYYAGLDPPALIDPMIPKEGIDWFRQHGEPAHIFMTNRLHDRDCQAYIDTYGATVWCHRTGLHEFEDGGLAVSAFDHGDELPGGVKALEVGVPCPEETALLIPLVGGVLAIGDALVRWEGEIGFVPDYLLGDDPAAIKVGIRDAFLRICDDFDFDHLLFAHGDPLIGGGKAELRRYLEALDC